MAESMDDSRYPAQVFIAVADRGISDHRFPVSRAPVPMVHETAVGNVLAPSPPQRSTRGCHKHADERTASVLPRPLPAASVLPRPLPAVPACRKYGRPTPLLWIGAMRITGGSPDPNNSPVARPLPQLGQAVARQQRRSAQRKGGRDGGGMGHPKSLFDGLRNYRYVVSRRAGRASRREGSRRWARSQRSSPSVTATAGPTAAQGRTG